jgi:D-xylose transport system substrate-binding protein
MKKSLLVSILALASLSALTLSGCSNATNGTNTTSGGAEAVKRACVILPDSDSSNRWENGDRPALEAAFAAAGYETDIQNAQNDTAKFATIAEQQLTKGCGVFLLVDLQGAGVQVAVNAKAQGIPVIAYDRPIEGADYYVSFDNKKVGALQGQSIVGGDPSDGNAAMFHDGADEVMAAAGIVPAFETPGTWDPVKAGTQFEQAYTALQGKIDAVWVANDNNAAAVIAILDKNGLTVPVSGQDASPAGLQNVLLGKQAATVYKPFKLEAAAAVKLAVEILSGGTPVVDAENKGVPFLALVPILVGPDDVQQVIDAGDAKLSDICTADVAAACAAHGVK